MADLCSACTHALEAGGVDDVEPGERRAFLGGTFAATFVSWLCSETTQLKDLRRSLYNDNDVGHVGRVPDT